MYQLGPAGMPRPSVNVPPYEGGIGGLQGDRPRHNENTSIVSFERWVETVQPPVEDPPVVVSLSKQELSQHRLDSGLRRNDEVECAGLGLSCTRWT